MSEPSFLAIFFTLLAASLFCALQSVDGEIVYIHKKNVTVENDIDPNIALNLHCWSSEDDLGEHTLYHKQIFMWSFKVNYFVTTKFVCDSSWYDPAGKSNHTEEFTAYDAGRDWNTLCKNDCRWSIRRDGGYYGDGTDHDDFPLKKMFSFN